MGSFRACDPSTCQVRKVSGCQAGTELESPRKWGLGLCVVDKSPFFRNLGQFPERECDQPKDTQLIPSKLLIIL